MHLFRSDLEFSNLYKFDGKVKIVLIFIDFLFIRFNSLVQPLITPAIDGLMRYDPIALTDYLHTASMQMI
jgi:hypothetical protein